MVDGWREEISEKLRAKPEDIPSVIKRCPKCKKLTLAYDPEKHKVICGSCGFEQSLLA